MAFLETPRFPDLIARGLTCGPSFSTRVVAMRSGSEQRNANWSRVRWRADAASAVRTMTAFAALEEFFYAVGGRLHGFRVRDPGDHTSDSAGGTAVLIPLDADGLATGTAGAGYGVPTCQLAKQYATGALAHNRWITKPVSGAVVTRNGAAVATGTGAGKCTVSTTTGVVTFGADEAMPIAGHASTSDGKHVITLTNPLSSSFGVGTRIWVTGVTGTAAGVLNQISLAVTDISGADLEVAVDTDGLTAANGAVSVYPQGDDVLAWTGEFDVPARFDTDQLDRQMLTRQVNGEYLVQALSIPLIEVRD